MVGLLQSSFAIAFTMKSLSPAERKLLKARAHALKPVVTVGNERLSASVLKEIETSLKAHDLIKIRVTGDDRDARLALLGEICSRTGASAVQHIGKILVVYRESQEAPASAPKKRAARKPPRRTKRSYQNA
jgi:putative YhbY family RNA-binding protein